MLKWDEPAGVRLRLRQCALIAAVALSMAGFALASESGLDFTVHNLSSDRPGRTALIVGGIQGDEPGGFNAAALIATHYRIRSGRVIVVPNLNFPSIVKRSRGIYGDMNRKFDRIDTADPQRETIDRIKAVIRAPEVDFILNLHDGSGFYTPTYESPQRHPGRWGQSIIIDQEAMSPGRRRTGDQANVQDRGQAANQSGGQTEGRGIFTRLARVARECAEKANQRILDPSHAMGVKNTRTAEGNQEMAKTLTFFALRHDKPAFGVEASKSFLTPRRVYYHLLVIEAFLEKAGIGFHRGFPLTEAGIRRAIDQDIALSLGDRRVLVVAENIRKRINFLPMEKEAQPRFYVNHPLLTLVPSGEAYSLFHGNRRLTRLSPQYFEYDLGLAAIDMVVDGMNRSVSFGSLVSVKDRFLVPHIPEHRVNIIGFTRQGQASESGFVIRKNQFSKRFSIDRDGEIYRIEVYKGKKFNGMVLVDFRGGAAPLRLAGADVTERAPGDQNGELSR